MADTPRHSVSVAGIVVNNADQVLVVQRRDNGHWEPPGGVLELDEQFEEGVHREVREETGMDVRVERLTGVYKNLTRGIVAAGPASGTHRPPAGGRYQDDKILTVKASTHRPGTVSGITRSVHRLRFACGLHAIPTTSMRATTPHQGDSQELQKPGKEPGQTGADAGTRTPNLPLTSYWQCR